MKNKKKQILEGAMQLFSQKGFQQTSMQEIADYIGVAKGSIYHYYKSKEDLLREIIWQYYEKISKQIDEIEQDEILTVRQKFLKQLIVHLAIFIENRDFILINLKSSFDFNDQFESFCIQVHKEIYQWLEEKFIKLYGEEMKPYTLDLSTSLQGMVKEYLSHILFEDVEMNLEELANHLLKQCDILAEGLKTYGKPFLTKDMFQKRKNTNKNSVEEIIHQIKTKALETNNSTISEISDALLAHCQKRNNQSSIIIESLIFYLENINDTLIDKEEIQKLKSALDTD